MDSKVEEAARELINAASAGFVTSNSNGWAGKYWVEADFKTLKESQRFYRALVDLAVAMKRDFTEATSSSGW